MPRLTLATWNINSVRLRLPLLRTLVASVNPDVICLQETKVPDPFFPREAIAELGYPHQAIAGMKGYHGVATLSRVPLESLGAHDFCEKGDPRHVAVRLTGAAGGIELHNFYVPAGGDVPDPEANDKFAHKLRFLDELEAFFGRRRDRAAARAIMVGDLNVAPGEHDVWSHRQLLDVVSHTPPETERLTRARDAFGWTDATRHFVPQDEKIFTWWSYRNRDWRASNRGRRLDHVWVSGKLTPALKAHTILKDARDWERPSDHVPVVVRLAI